MPKAAKYFGIRRDRGVWLAAIEYDGIRIAVGRTSDDDFLAELRDRILRHMKAPRRLLNFPSRRLQPIELEAARRLIRARNRRGRSSRYRGVQRVADDRWSAKIEVNTVVWTLGTWPSEKRAADAYDRAAVHFSGKHEVNFPSSKPSPASPARLRSEAWALVKKDTSSRYRGVCYDGRPNRVRLIWEASIKVDARSHRLGSYENERDAAIAYDRAGIHFFGDRAVLNLQSSRKLGPATPTELRNLARRVFKETTTSSFRGVFFEQRTSRWRAEITFESKRHFLRRYDSAEEAAHAYDAAVVRLGAPSGWLNFKGTRSTNRPHSPFAGRRPSR